jgi:hypothetical protein
MEWQLDSRQGDGRARKVTSCLPHRQYIESDWIYFSLLACWCWLVSQSADDTIVAQNADEYLFSYGQTIASGTSQKPTMRFFKKKDMLLFFVAQ